ncbi:MAG: HEAT repeat domain-containing protein, partial [Planctomycetota bacterium]
PLSGIQAVLLGALVGVGAAYFLLLRAWARDAVEAMAWLVLAYAVGGLVAMWTPVPNHAGLRSDPDGSPGLIFLYLAAWAKLATSVAAGVVGISCVVVLRFLRSPRVRQAFIGCPAWRPMPSHGARPRLTADRILRWGWLLVAVMAILGFSSQRLKPQFEIMRLKRQLHSPIPTRFQTIPAEAAMPVLAELLHDDSPLVRTSAASLLGQIGPPAAPTVPALAAALRDESPACREAAVKALQSIGREALPAAPALVEALRDGDPSVRRAAATALRDVSPRERIAEAALTEALADRDHYVRVAAAETLAHVGSAPEAGVVALVEVLEEGKGHVRNHACWALGGLGSAAHSAVPALIEALADPAVRRSAAVALGRIGPRADAAVGPLERLVENGDAELSRAASEALNRIRADDMQPRGSSRGGS